MAEYERQVRLEQQSKQQFMKAAGSAPQATTTASGPAPSTGGLFGSAPAPSSTGGLFGSSPAPGTSIIAFCVLCHILVTANNFITPSNVIFHAPSLTLLFSSILFLYLAPSGGLFGSNPAPASSAGFGGFGAPQPASAPAPGGLFGSTPGS
jgi:hypothetical protein